jgi:hypothetical protein
MNVTLSMSKLERARRKAEAMSKSLNQVIRDCLQSLSGGDDQEPSIEEFKRLSGTGHSRGWRFKHEEIHERT